MNFQNIPRKDKVVKRAFLPKLDALLFFDYSQIEFLLLAYYCAKLGDRSMVDVLSQGNDLHAETAIGALRLSGPPEDWQRQLGKQINYSLIYGGAKPAIRRYADCSWKEAGDILDGFHERWPGVGLVKARIDETLDTRGYLKSLAGRRLHPRSSHSALNTLIQGGAAELKRWAVVKVHKALADYESHLVLEVHDELILDAIDDEVPALVEQIPKLMDYEPVSSIIQIETDCEWTHTNWAAKEPYERI